MKTHLLVLIGSHSDKFRFLEDVTSKRGIREFDYVVGPNEMKPWLVFVHGIQYRLKQNEAEHTLGQTILYLIEQINFIQVL